MRFFTTAIALLPLVASTLAARPSEGTYAIVNQVLSPKGEKLAVTFNGGGNAVTLTPYCESSNTQHVCLPFVFIVLGLRDYCSGNSGITMLVKLPCR